MAYGAQVAFICLHLHQTLLGGNRGKRKAMMTVRRNIDWIDEAVIYQIMVDRFNGEWKETENGNHFMGGTLKGVMDKLDYIQGMGFTSIWLSPVACSVNYHGYHVTDFLHVDSHFGTMDDLSALIKAIHARGMTVLVDYVPNHCSVEHPYFKEAMAHPHSAYRRWFYINEDNSYKSFLNFGELAKINLDYDEAADYMINVARLYCQLGVDGLRIDHAVGPSFAFWKKAMTQLTAEFPNRIFFGEVWAQGIHRCSFHTLHFKSFFHKIKYYFHPSRQESWQQDYVGVLDGVLDFVYRGLLLEAVEQGKGIIGNRELEERVRRHFASYPSDYKLLLFLDNHDTDRFLFNARGDVRLLEEAIRFTCQWHRPFIIYYGTEQGMRNEESVFSGKPYADLAVRRCMDWNLPKEQTLYGQMKKWLQRHD